jgi:hypothetical protein
VLGFTVYSLRKTDVIISVNLKQFSDAKIPRIKAYLVAESCFSVPCPKIALAGAD